MTTQIKAGITLIIIGIFLHIISIPYMVGYNPLRGYFASMPYMRIIIKDNVKEYEASWQGKDQTPRYILEAISEKHKNIKNVELPYKHVVAFTTLLILLGIMIILFSPRRQKEQDLS